MLIELILVLALAFIIRFIFILAESNDDYVHLWNIKLRKQLGNPFKHYALDSLIDGRRGYPVLYHYLISIFPEKYWSAIAYLTNVSCDLLLIVAVYFISLLFFENKHQYVDNFAVFSPQAYVCLLIASSPLLLPVSARVASMGARTFGGLLSFFYFIALGWLLVEKQYMGIVVCLIAGLVIIMSSQFALQATLFISIGLCIYFMSVIPLLVILLCLLVAVAIPKLGLKDILAFKYEHARWYRRNYHNVDAVGDRNNLRQIFKLPQYIYSDFRKFLELGFYKNSITIVLYSALPAVILFLLMALNKDVLYLLKDPIANYAFAITLISLFIFAATSFRPLLFLGRAERYFEYSLPFFSFLYVLAISKSMGVRGDGWLIYILLTQLVFCMVNFVGLNFKVLSKRMQGDQGKLFNEVINYLKTLKEKHIITIPIKLSFMISYSLFGEHKYYYRSINTTGKSKGFSYMEEDLVWFELLRPDFSYFANKYSIDTIVVDKLFLTPERLKRAEYDFSSLETLYENEAYSVFRIT